MAERKTRQVQGNGPDDTAPEESTRPTVSESSSDGAVAPIGPGHFQPGQKVEGVISTRVPRGVGEPPADAIADEPAAAALQGHVQKVIEDEEKRGFRGSKRDNIVPNYNYTLRGVGDPSVHTPEEVAYTPPGEDQ